MKTVAQLLKLKAQQNQEVHTIAPHQMVLEALMVMAAKNVGALPVVKNGEVIGIISERDYARKLVLKGRSSVGTPVEDIMVVAGHHRGHPSNRGNLHGHHVRQTPAALAGGGRRPLIGLLSIGDLVKEAIAEQAELIRQLEQYIRGE